MGCEVHQETENTSGPCGRVTTSAGFRDKVSGESKDGLVFCVSMKQISSLCAEEAAAQEQTGQVEECLKVNLLKIKTDACKKVNAARGLVSLPALPKTFSSLLML